MAASSPARTRPVRGSPPRHSLRRAARFGRRDLVLIVGLTLFALVIRWPEHELIPALTDEGQETAVALQIVAGRGLPLTSNSPYIGSLWNFLVAAALVLTGGSLDAPRLVALTFGVLTVAATYLLGRAWGGPLAGALGGALLATSATHVVVSSHVAWSNCITPCFTTLATWLLVRSVALARGRPDRSGRLLLLSGLAWGLAFQTHPAAIALLAGGGIYLVWRGRSLLQTRWPYLAALGFLLVNLNLLIYNLTNGFESFAFGARVADSYANHEPLGPLVFARRVAWLLLNFFQGLGGAVDSRDRPADFLADPGLWPIVLLVVSALAWLWRRGNPLPGLLAVSTVLILPVFNGRLDGTVRWPVSMLNLRYLAPMLPILYASAGALLAAEAQRLRSDRPWRLVPSAALGPPLLAGFCIFLLIHALLPLQTYYALAHRRGLTNEHFLRTMRAIETNRRPGEVVLLDEALERRRIQWGADWAMKIFRTSLAIVNVPYLIVDLEHDEPLTPGSGCPDQLVVLASRGATSLAALSHGGALRQIDSPPVHPQPDGYRLYRRDRSPAEHPGGC